ncbi:MAG: hypothetical protein NTV60_02830 [Candidatus Kaiserbacteria bacterium]|nr:hypothetical protein [Candidatus Kaiserbacteria bacterium]
MEIRDKAETVKIAVLYSIEQEMQRVLYTIKRLPWYTEQGYSATHITIPSGITEDSTDEDVAQVVNAEFLSEDYVLYATKLEEEWRIIAGGFEKMRVEPSFHLKNEYGVVLTKYGMGGSYDADASVAIIKMNTQSQGGSAGTVVHEIMHMTIQHLIDQYHVRHWYKERLVDLLMERYFPGLKKTQTIKEDVSIVDRAFEKFFPNMDAITQSIGKSEL